MHLLLCGTTGAVGQWVLREALRDSSIDRITVLSRRPIEVQDPRLTVHLLQDFLADPLPEDIVAAFPKLDACIWTIGVVPRVHAQIGNAAAHRINVDMPLNVAKQILKVNQQVNFVYCSAFGTCRDQNATYRILKFIEWPAKQKVGILYNASLEWIANMFGQGKAELEFLKLQEQHPEFKVYFPGIGAPVDPSRTWYAAILARLGFGNRADVLANSMLALAKSGYRKDIVTVWELELLGRQRMGL